LFLGATNAVSSLKIAKFECDLYNNHLIKRESKDDQQSLSLYFMYADYEYLVRCDWYSKDCIWVQLLDRLQKNLVFGLFNLNSTFPSQILYKEDNDHYWVCVSDVSPFPSPHNKHLNSVVELKSGSIIEFIWLSHKTGFRHIYHIEVMLREFDENRQSQGIESGLSKANSNLENVDGLKNNLLFPVVIPESIIVSETQLTKGDWEVSNEDVWLDQKEGLIYFVGFKDTPLEKHLYSVPIKNNSNQLPIKRLTEKGFCNSVITFNSTLDLFINIQSNILISSFGYVSKKIDQNWKHFSSYFTDRSDEETDDTSKDDMLDTGFQKLALIINNSFNSKSKLFISSLMSESRLNVSLTIEHIDSMTYLNKPELFTYKLKKSGEIIYGVIFKPEFMEFGVKYPCVLDIYGGPEFQTITNSFKNIRPGRRHLLSSEGYVVCAFDCRGSHNRGLKFEAHSYKRLGQVEIDDQVEVLEWLAETTGFIDMSRVAVCGWSYGGYLSLMALIQRQDIFKIAIAGAPVTNWSLYDTGYTERYMDLPCFNPEGYSKSSILNWVNSFPDEENRLLLIHGLMDENVHFIHTQELIQALIQAGKPYHLQVSI